MTPAGNKELAVTSHSQFVSNASKRVGIKLASAARTRRGLEDVQAEHREQAIVNAAVVSAGGEATTNHDDAHCTYCGARRKLAFINGKRGRATCHCMKIGAKRRRLSFKQPDTVGVFNPDGNPPPDTGTVNQEDARGHILMIVDELTWCFRCGSYSTERIHGLNQECKGTPGEGQAFRLSHLRRSRHPVTNQSFSGSVKRLRVV